MSTAAQPRPEENETSSPELTTEVFKTHMAAMRLHYKSGQTTAYALPSALIHPMTASGVLIPAVTSRTTTVPGQADLDAALKTNQTQTQTLVQNQKDFLSAQTNTLQTSKNTDAFQQALNNQRAAAKAQSDQNIDNLYDKLGALGEAHPSLQSTILSTTQKIGAFFTSLLASVASFFTNIYNKIVGWIKSATNWIGQAASSIQSWASGAVGTIVSFFGSIF